MLMTLFSPSFKIQINLNFHSFKLWLQFFPALEWLKPKENSLTLVHVESEILSSFSFPNPLFPMNDLPYFEWNKKQPSHTEQISCPPNDSIWALPKNPSTTLGFLGSGGHTNLLTPMTAERLKCAQHAQPWISSIIQWASKIAMRYIHYLPAKVNCKWK